RDGSMSACWFVHFTFNHVNLPPEIWAIVGQTLDEGHLLQFTISATDPDGDVLTYSTTGLPEGASFDPSTQTFNWTPSYNQAGTYTVTFQVSDGSLIASRDVHITVNQVNLPPELAVISDQIVDEGKLLKFTVNATDPDEDVLVYSATGIPEEASFDPTTHTFNWTPNYTQAGSYKVTFQVSDGNLTASKDVLIIVNQVNLPPELAVIGDRTVEEGQLLTFNVSATDPDGDVLTYSATGIPEGANFDPATQVFSWTPKLNQAGVYEVIFAVTDGLSKSQKAVSITVREVNDSETKIKALIELLIRIIEKSKLPDHYKSKIINELRKLGNYNKVEVNKLRAIIYGIKAQIGKKVPREIEDTIENLLEEICKLDGHRNSKPGKDDHWKKDNKPDKDDCWEKDCKADKDDHHEEDRKSGKNDRSGDKQDEKRHRDNR
ncbi:MAG: putative Ig domain-containing protein, partial [Bacteroidota bacterium]